MSSLLNIVSKNNPLNHYHWGGKSQCDGWILVDEIGLSVKLERMPPDSSEQKHVHRSAQQFFFILGGKAVFEIDNERFELEANQGILILPGQMHRITNEWGEDLELILSSQPSIGRDRFDVE